MVFLSDLMKAGIFRGAVNDLVDGFRREYRLPEVHQLGLIVEDVEKAALDLEARGIEPFFIVGGTPSSWRELGGERSVRAKIGLAHYEGVELELIEPFEGSGFHARSLDPEGGIVVQHLAFRVGDVDTWARWFAAAGYPTSIRGALGAGPIRFDFAYADARETLGLYVEFISSSIAGWPFKPSAHAVGVLGRLQKWSGLRSISL